VKKRGRNSAEDFAKKEKNVEVNSLATLP